MQEIGARRIARSIFINQNTFKFCDDELTQRFRKIHLLEGYIEQVLNNIIRRTILIWLKSLTEEESPS